MKKRIKEWIKWYLVYIVLALAITFGWQGLELLFYGEIQHRIVDDIVGFVLLLSILLNVIFIKAIYISKSEREKYVVLDKDTYENLRENNYKDNYKEYYWTLKTIQGNCKCANLIVSNTIKNECGEETSTVKFDNIKSFAQYVKAFNDINIDYIEKKIGDD